MRSAGTCDDSVIFDIFKVSWFRQQAGDVFEIHWYPLPKLYLTSQRPSSNCSQATGEHNHHTQPRDRTVCPSMQLVRTTSYTTTWLHRVSIYATGEHKVRLNHMIALWVYLFNWCAKHVIQHVNHLINLNSSVNGMFFSINGMQLVLAQQLQHIFKPWVDVHKNEKLSFVTPQCPSIMRLINVICNLHSRTCPIVDLEAIMLTKWLHYFNSVLNPIIYSCMTRDFRNAFKKLGVCAVAKVMGRYSTLERGTSLSSTRGRVSSRALTDMHSWKIFFSGYISYQHLIKHWSQGLDRMFM